MTENLTQTKRIKRKRGGQKGNQNARKHGFYSSTLTPAEICRFWNIVNLESVEPELAVLRIKLESLLRYDPGNRRILGEASRLLVKWCCSKYRLKRNERKYVEKIIYGVFERCFATSPGRNDRLTEAEK